jgi:hypothetical protein
MGDEGMMSFFSIAAIGEAERDSSARAGPWYRISRDEVNHGSRTFSRVHVVFAVDDGAAPRPGAASFASAGGAAAGVDGFRR